MRILYVNFVLDFVMRRNNFELVIIKELQKLGHKVSVVVMDLDPYFHNKKEIEQASSNGKRSVEIIDEPIEVYGIPVYVLHCVSQKFGMYCPNAKMFANRIIKNYDVIHIANWYHHLAFVFSKIAFQYRIPFVFSAYATLQPETRSYRKREKWIIDKIYTKKMIRSASALHSVGDSETKEYVKLGADPNRIYRIDPAIALENFVINERTNIFERIGVDLKNKQYLLFISRIVKRKKIELLLRAFVRLTKTRENLILVIVGSGTKSYEQELKELTYDLGINDKVIFTGRVIGNEKLELLESARLFVHTSNGDVHSVAVQEALTMGIPAVITNTNDFPEIEEYKAGISVEPDENSLYEGLNKMLEDENKLAIYSRNARKLVSERFLAVEQVKKYEDMYRYAIENNQYQNIN